jgi:hypothetical protein
MYHDGKNRAMPRSRRPYEIVTKAKDPVDGLWSLVTKNVFYCRAVTINGSLMKQE